MKPCLVDINIVLALLARNHVHHARVRKWFGAARRERVGLCRFVQLGVIRLLGNSSIMGEHAIAAIAGWELISALLDDERVEYACEPLGLETHLANFLNRPMNPGKLVSDAYLAAFAVADARTLATLDRGFRGLSGLEVEIL
jgi:uncharacterized protein